APNRSDAFALAANLRSENSDGLCRGPDSHWLPWRRSVPFAMSRSQLGTISIGGLKERFRSRWRKEPPAKNVWPVLPVRLVRAIWKPLPSPEGVRWKGSLAVRPKIRERFPKFSREILGLLWLRLWPTLHSLNPAMPVHFANRA